MNVIFRWSVGITMMQLFTNRFPYKARSKTKIRREILNFKGIEWLKTETPPEDFKEIISQFLKVKPKSKLTDAGRDERTNDVKSRVRKEQTRAE